MNEILTTKLLFLPNIHASSGCRGLKFVLRPVIVAEMENLYLSQIAIKAAFRRFFNEIRQAKKPTLKIRPSDNPNFL